MRLESARIRLKEGSYHYSNTEGGHGPFRGLDAPFALTQTLTLSAYHVNAHR